VKWSVYKYALPLIIFAGAARSFVTTGFEIWIPVLYAFFIIPLAELFIKPSEANINNDDEKFIASNRIYDYFLYTIVPLQYLLLLLFLKDITNESLSLWDKTGRTMAMGLLCGVFGINVAHELGHRVNKTEQLLAKCLLLTSLYMHFFIEHNRGHHKDVATPYDPSTARYNQTLYAFWIRSILGVYRKAWIIATKEQSKRNLHFFRNEMLQYQALEIGFCLVIGLVFSWGALGYFLVAALIGVLLLETVNYIEHYGLVRKEITLGKFERTLAEHSWNSNHSIGRLMLFELSRHSDHHYLASRKYQLLRHHENSPQLPTGYPGSMLLAMIPPLWFHIMNRRIQKYKDADIIHPNEAKPGELY